MSLDEWTSTLAGQSRFTSSEDCGDRWSKESKETDLESLPGFPVTTVLIAALDAAAVLLADLLDQERRLTGGASLWNRAIPEGKFTLGIITAREK